MLRGGCLCGAIRYEINGPMGTLDDDPGVRPSYHIFVGSKAAWYDITDNLPQFDTFPASER